MVMAFGHLPTRCDLSLSFPRCLVIPRHWLQDYHYLRNNCGHFCETLIHRLCVPGKIPGS